MAYVADLEGKITKINLTDQGTLWKNKYYLTQLNSTNGRYLYRPVMTFNDGNLWLYFGIKTLNIYKSNKTEYKIDFRLKTSIFQF